jgi:nucleoid-associated protein YgaU
MGRRRFTTAVAVVAATSVLLGCRALDEANSRGSAPWQTTKTGQTSRGGATATSVQRVYVVQSGDTLHSIAERECGNGASVEALAAANVGRRQPDGTALKDPDAIRTGWELVISCRSGD